MRQVAPTTIFLRTFRSCIKRSSKYYYRIILSILSFILRPILAPPPLPPLLPPLPLLCRCQNYRHRPRPKETRMASRHSPHPAFSIDVLYRRAGAAAEGMCAMSVKYAKKKKNARVLPESRFNLLWTGDLVSILFSVFFFFQQQEYAKKG